MPLRRNNRLAIIYRTFLLVNLFGLLPALSAQAATMLTDCFHSISDYDENYLYELAAVDNTVGDTLASAHIVADGPVLTASCNCPSSIKSTTKIYSATHVGSPLPQGHASNFGILTDILDINVTGYSDSIKSASGSGLFAIRVDAYPSTDVSQMNSDTDNITSQEQTATVCSAQTRPTSVTTPRQFKWNVIAAVLYLKKTILGEEIIPRTIVAQHYSCLADSSITKCPTGSAQQVSNIWLSGRITAPLSCTINGGSTLEVELGTVAGSAFMIPGQPPKGYTLKSANVTYHCDDPAAANVGKIKMTLTSDQGVSSGSEGLIAKMIGRDDIGVRMYDGNGNDIALDGSIDLPITLDEQGNGTAIMQAAPVGTGKTRPAPGKYEGNVTVKMDIK